MPWGWKIEIVWLVAGVGIAGLILAAWLALRGSIQELLLRQGEMQQAHAERFHEQEERFDHAMAELRDSQIRALLGLQRSFMEQANGQTHLLEQRLSEIRLNLVDRFVELEKATSGGIGAGQMRQQQALADLQAAMQRALVEHREQLEQRQREQGLTLHATLQSGMEAAGRQMAEHLSRNSEELGRRMAGLTETTEKRLGEISGQVEKRLSDGFERTTETFSQVLQHLTRIDEAQKRITELSSNVVSLQEVLADKRSRGAFGEVQLAGLIRNLLPERSFALQHTLQGGNRVDCMLFLPEPTGNLAIDAKFPLESYQRLADPHLPEPQREQAASQFPRDIRKHIDDIASKYIVPGETADGAVMFIPAEAVFAEIHARFPALVEEAQRKRVWLVSPTTLMAVLTTARAVLKDAETRQQIHIIQDHLQALSQDFGRFRARMDNLAKHIKQANQDVAEIHVSAGKISSRFEKIERVELDELGAPMGVLAGRGEAIAQDGTTEPG